MSRTATPQPTPVRVGFVLLGLLAVADLAELALTDGKHPPYSIAAISAALGVVSLVCLLPAWRGSAPALRILAACRAVSALAAVPAFIASGVPAAAVAAAAAIVVLTAAGLILVLSGRQSRTAVAR